MRSLFVLALLATVWSCQSPTPTQNQPKTGPDAISVRLQPVEQVSAAEPVVATGLLSPRQEVRLSFKVGGVVSKLFVREGQAVQKGQLLATLNTAELDAQVAQAGQLFSKAERDWQRTQRLYQDSVATLEQAQNQTTALETSRQTLAMARANQGLSRLYATLSGVVQARPVNEGELVSPGMPVVMITGTGVSDWVLRVGVADKAWTRLKTGDRAEVRLDAFGGELLPAQVVALSQGADPASGLYQADLLIRASRNRLVAGLFGKATIYPAGRQSLVAIPADAIVEGDNEQAFAFVSDGKVARKRQLRVLYVRGNKAFVNLTGNTIAAVITDGSAYLEDGSPIRVVQ